MKKLHIIDIKDECFVSSERSVCRLTFMQDKPVVWLSTLYTDLSYRRRGNAKMLLNQVERIVKMRGGWRITLSVSAGTWMQEWYERSGYEVIAEQDEMIIMSKKI